METERQVLAVGAPIDHRMSLEEAIKEYVRIQERYSELAEEKKRVMEVLIPAATEVKPQKSNTARLANHDRSVILKAEFGASIVCDVNMLNEVKEMLGDDVFESLFKLEYKCKQRGLKPFLAEKTTDERRETAKQKIVMALDIRPTPPSFSIEKG